MAAVGTADSIPGSFLQYDTREKVLDALVAIEREIAAAAATRAGVGMAGGTDALLKPFKTNFERLYEGSEARFINSRVLTGNALKETFSKASPPLIGSLLKSETFRNMLTEFGLVCCDARGGLRDLGLLAYLQQRDEDMRGYIGGIVRTHKESGLGLLGSKEPTGIEALRKCLEGHGNIAEEASVIMGKVEGLSSPEPPRHRNPDLHIAYRNLKTLLNDETFTASSRDSEFRAQAASEQYKPPVAGSAVGAASPTGGPVLPVGGLTHPGMRGSATPRTPAPVGYTPPGK